jgi:protein-L-isoaspartate(D-aspartate) O-methyltransferase
VKDAGGIRRSRMVRELSSRGIADPRVLEAIGAVPREPFVEEALRAKAYTDAPLPIGEKQTISQPWVVARMCELAGPDDAARVLEIGTGSGYHAAVLSRLFAQVFSVERLAALSKRAQKTVRALGIENVHFKICDGTYGWSEFAPYRAIVVTAAAPDVPAPLLEQLEPGGRLVLPLAAGRPDEGEGEDQTLVRVVLTPGGPRREEHGPCRFVPLVGKFGWER